MRHLFEYALLRAVPRIERGERVNVGVLLYCQGADFLGACTHLDADRVRALDPTADLDGLRAGLDAIERACAGGDGGGPSARLRPGERFRWLTAPRSTVIQAGPVHTGLTGDPAAELDRLVETLVLPPAPDRDARPG